MRSFSSGLGNQWIVDLCRTDGCINGTILSDDARLGHSHRCGTRSPALSTHPQCTLLLCRFRSLYLCFSSVDYLSSSFSQSLSYSSSWCQTSEYPRQQTSGLQTLWFRHQPCDARLTIHCHRSCARHWTLHPGRCRWCIVGRCVQFVILAGTNGRKRSTLRYSSWYVGIGTESVRDYHWHTTVSSDVNLSTNEDHPNVDTRLAKQSTHLRWYERTGHFLVCFTCYGSESLGMCSRLKTNVEERPKSYLDILDTPSVKNVNPTPSAEEQAFVQHVIDNLVPIND